MAREVKVGKPLGQILIEEGLIAQPQLDAALKHQRLRGGPLGQVLVNMGVVRGEDILLALGSQAGMPVVDLNEIEVSPEVVEKVSSSLAEIYRIVPISFEDDVLTVAMADPLNFNALHELRVMLQCEVKGAVSNEEQVSAAMRKYYGSNTEQWQDVLKDIETQGEGAIALQSVPENERSDILEDGMWDAAPVKRLLNLVMTTAIRDQSSDIHFEPFENEFRIRYRLDGVLLEMPPPPRHLAMPLVSRIKVISHLDIAERRVPQDGRLSISVARRPIDIRVATLPTMFGESVVMRILDRSVVQLDMERLGMRDDEMGYMREIIARPNGIILVTGPTGCGKTTTLYAALRELNTPEVKIITTEDPVEYDIDGIVQVPINDEIEVTYARCLRSILRQDPDIILVGEIRDRETAAIAIESSLTGHLVFSTLHTNDAPSTVTRVLDIGLEPFLVAATLEAVVAQRLVRVICTNCKEAYRPSQESLASLGLPPDEADRREFYYGKGCDNCNRTGYRGRSAIYEIMRIDSNIRDLIIQEKSTSALREAAQAAGMRTLRDAGILKIFDGATTIDEVVRETLAFE